MYMAMPFFSHTPLPAEGRLKQVLPDHQTHSPTEQSLMESILENDLDLQMCSNTEACEHSLAVFPHSHSRNGSRWGLPTSRLFQIPSTHMRTCTHTPPRTCVCAHTHTQSHGFLCSWDMAKHIEYAFWLPGYVQVCCDTKKGPRYCMPALPSLNMSLKLTVHLRSFLGHRESVSLLVRDTEDG